MDVREVCRKKIVVKRPLLLLIAATIGVASMVILAADPKPSSRVTTQTADPQTAADLPASGVEDTPTDSSAAATQPSAAVSSDPSASSKSESSTTTTATATTSTTSTTTTTTSTPEPTPTSLAPEPLGVELVVDTTTNANANANKALAPKADTTEASEQGQVYVWYDGDRTRRVLLQSDLTVQTGSDGQGDEVVARSAVTGTQANRQALPVFRSESSGNLMTLPGGVLVLFDSELDDAQISKFFTEQGISEDRVSPMLLDNAFQILTEPGFPALKLANRLATSAELLLASPNWSFSAVTK